MIASGLRRHLVLIETPGDREMTPDGDWRDTWVSLGTRMAAILPATAHQAERIRQGTVTATRPFVITLPYLDGLSTLARVIFSNRVFHVLDVENPEERNVELVLYCAEQETLATVPLETGTP